MIWAFVDVLGRRLVLWCAVSALLAVPMLAWGGAFGRGVAAMFLAWGAVDALLGVAARWFAERNRRRHGSTQAIADREARRLRRILLANAGLDVIYVAGGIWLWATGADAFAAGCGLGIVVQGAFLLAFDLFHARWVPSAAPIFPPDIELFAGPKHLGFRLAAEADPAGGGRADNGALLLHGFGGTPAELRGIAAVLASEGWVAEVPLLPGFGPEIRRLPDVRYEDWVAEVDAAAARLRADAGGRLLLLGHSMGASLALAMAGRLRPDGVVVLAPFLWPEPAWLRAIAPLARAVLPPGIRPFRMRNLDMDAADVRTGIASFLPGMNLDDPEVRRALRDMVVPLSVFEQLFRASREAVRGAPAVTAPVLVLQGRADEVARSERTARLLALLPAPAHYVELEAGHDLMTDESPVRDATLAAVLAFAREVAGR